MNTKSLTAKDFDKKFVSGEDLTDQLDFSKARRVNQESKRVNIDFPLWIVGQLDKRSKRLGIHGKLLLKFGLPRN